ncbi:MAG: aldehyde ferredoxin oxidoreductase N-terminal domain-containing protein [Anaerolineales bacterium]
MPHGYNGKILHVDLTTGDLTIEEPEEKFYRKYMGGSAMGLYYLLKEMPAGVDPLGPDDRFVSFLPMAWIGEQMMSFACRLQVGFVIHCPEEPETAFANLREIGPQAMFSPPRIWESLVSQVMVKMEDSSRLKRACYNGR